MTKIPNSDIAVFLGTGMISLTENNDVFTIILTTFSTKRTMHTLPQITRPAMTRDEIILILEPIFKAHQESRIDPLKGKKITSFVRKWLVRKSPFNYTTIVDPVLVEDEIIASLNALESYTGGLLEESLAAIMTFRSQGSSFRPKKGQRYKTSDGHEVSIVLDHVLRDARYLIAAEQKTAGNACNSNEVRSIEFSFANTNTVAREQLPDLKTVCILAHSMGTSPVKYRKFKSGRVGGYFEMYGYDTWEYFSGLRECEEILLELGLKYPIVVAEVSQSDRLLLRREVQRLVGDGNGGIDLKKWLQINSQNKTPKTPETPKPLTVKQAARVAQKNLRAAS